VSRGMVILAIAALGRVASAQAPMADTSVKFDVVSVKPSAPGGQGITISGFNPSQFSVHNAPLNRILVFAYELRDVEQVVGGPAWVRSETFDMAAKAAGNPPASQVPTMVRALLADRFMLRAHIEARDGPVYALRIARRDGTLGPNLHRTAVDCAALIASGQTGPLVGGRSLCTGIQSLSGRTRTLRTRGLPIAQVAEMLAIAAGRDVIDQTSLAGAFDAELAWTHDMLAQPRAGEPEANTGVSVFTAVREQLGLELVPERGPVKILVIDSVQRPTPD
jgi:uncharacterized protein (TIGR03435 family)